MMSSEENYSVRTYHSHGCLGTPQKDRKIFITCRSLPFLKPTLSLQKVMKYPFEKMFSFKKKRHSKSERDNFFVEDCKHDNEALAEPGGAVKVTTGIAAFAVNTEKQKGLFESSTPARKMKVEEIKNKNKYLSDWHRKFILTSENSVGAQKSVNGVGKTRSDLKKQRRKGPRTNLPPVMDSHMFHALQPHTTEKCNGTIERDEWKRITKSSAEVILDPNTSNPNLKLLRREKAVRTMTFEECRACDPWDGFQRTHSKYDGWACIQAKEGYASGRHYWEVDLRGKCDWRIGVVKESAPRNGFAKLNTETGYWTLRLQLGTLMALTAPVTKLNQPTPSRVGVYLDIEEGKISFYDVQKKRHIYTFNAEFSQSEKVYPVFGTVETDKPLVIV